MLRQVRLLPFLALPALGCAKGTEIAPSDVVIFTLAPEFEDAGADAAVGTNSAPGAAGASAAGGMTTSSPPAMPAAQAPSPSPSAGATSPSDAGTNDAGRSGDRPVDAGN